jgi:hypothetical protein
VNDNPANQFHAGTMSLQVRNLQNNPDLKSNWRFSATARSRRYRLSAAPAAYLAPLSISAASTVMIASSILPGATCRRARRHAPVSHNSHFGKVANPLRLWPKWHRIVVTGIAVDQDLRSLVIGPALSCPSISGLSAACYRRGISSVR